MKNPYPRSGLLARLVLCIYFDILYHITSYYNIGLQPHRTDLPYGKQNIIN